MELRSLSHGTNGKGKTDGKEDDSNHAEWMVLKGQAVQL